MTAATAAEWAINFDVDLVFLLAPTFAEKESSLISDNSDRIDWFKISDRGVRTGLGVICMRNIIRNKSRALIWTNYLIFYQFQIERMDVAVFQNCKIVVKTKLS